MDPAPTAPAPPPSAPAAPPGVLVFLLALAPLFVLGVLAQAAHPVLGLAWTEVFVLFLPAVIASQLVGLRTWPLLRVRWPGWKAVSLGFLTGLAGYVFASGLMLTAIKVLPQRWVEANDIGRLFQLPGWQPAGIAVVATLLAPFCEEVTFRGYLLSALSRRRPAVAIAGAALLFAVMHVDPVRFAAVLFLGVLFGWLAWRSNSIWPAVVAHAANNGSASALAFVAGAGPEPQPPPLLAIAGVLAIGAAFVAAAVAAFREATPLPPPLADALVPADAEAERPGARLHRVAPELLIAAAIGLALVPVLLLHAQR